MVAGGSSDLQGERKRRENERRGARDMNEASTVGVSGGRSCLQVILLRATVSVFYSDEGSLDAGSNSVCEQQATERTGGRTGKERGEKGEKEIVR